MLQNASSISLSIIHFVPISVDVYDVVIVMNNWKKMNHPTYNNFRKADLAINLKSQGHFLGLIIQINGMEL